LPPLPECRVPIPNSCITLPTFFCLAAIFIIILPRLLPKNHRLLGYDR
jgi:hypothetical protein